MSMNKIGLLVFLFLVLMLPSINVEAAASYSVSYRCQCVRENGVIDCRGSNCSGEIIRNKLQQKCGDGGSGTLSDEIRFTCGGITDLDPQTACNRYASSDSYGAVEIHMGVVAKATCEPGANARVADNFCTDVRETLRFLGYMLLFVKILVPFAIIFMATLDYYKAVMSSKNDEVKNQTKTFLKRLISGIVIFFIPSILHVAFSLVNGWTNIATEFETCEVCLLDPTECDG